MSETQANASDILQEFILFPNLPTEIRLQIWHIALNTDRTITLKYIEKPKPSAKGPDPNVRDMGYFTVQKDDNPAVLLGVNKEAREEALGFYHERIASVTCIGTSRWLRSGLEAQKWLYDTIRSEGKSIPVSFANTTFFLSTREMPRLPAAFLTRFQHVRFTVLDPGYFTFFTT